MVDRHWLYGNFHTITASESNSIDWCREVGIMKDPICDLFHRPTYIYQGGNSHFLRCNSCQKTLSLRRLSIFQYSRLPLSTCIKIIFFHMIREHSVLQIAQDLGYTHKAVRKFIKAVRRHISKQIFKSYFEDDPLGSENEPGRNHPTVEMDETKLLHWKNETRWVCLEFMIEALKNIGFFTVLTIGPMKNLKIIYSYQLLLIRITLRNVGLMAEESI
ncbi:unnamed protein product [Blepharisma stoltei]|uniref:Transposase n=1 Tax=Blepharisma stoltei TaxID=1481888 RepID=A0AAU9IQY0_9CILI|nr:unnamed protein product [Blepharisma stoltei]